MLQTLAELAEFKNPTILEKLAPFDTVLSKQEWGKRWAELMLKSNDVDELLKNAQAYCQVKNSGSDPVADMKAHMKTTFRQPNRRGSDSNIDGKDGKDSTDKDSGKEFKDKNTEECIATAAVGSGQGEDNCWAHELYHYHH